MPNLGVLLKLLLIVASTFGLIDSSDAELFAVENQRINSSLNITGTGLRCVSDGFVRDKFLTQLIMDKNKIRVVYPETFSNVPKLTYLSLADNLLTTLNLEPFSNLLELKTLILNGNCKPESRDGENNNQDYCDYDFTSRSRHRAVRSSCNLQIDAILPSLTHLYVASNTLQGISVVGSGRLPSLTYLDLSYNPGIMDTLDFSTLNELAPVITHLYLRYCNIFGLNLSGLRTVKFLHLEGNTIRNICINDCYNFMIDLHPAHQLETLYLSHNELSGLQRGSLQNLTNLVTLDLSYNRIAVIESGTFDELTMIKYLKLKNNRIAHMDVETFKYTINLVELDISHNQMLSLIEGTFDTLQNLEYLNLESNKFTRMDVVHTSRSLTKLKSLSLGGNNILHVSSEDFINMPTLETLTLNNNNLSIIESGTFLNLTNLKELSLADNQLESIPNDLMPISNSLISLNLSKNKFTSTENISLDNAPNLLSLSLKDNPLKTISADWLINVPENLNIFLGNTCL